MQIKEKDAVRVLILGPGDEDALPTGIVTGVTKTGYVIRLTTISENIVLAIASEGVPIAQAAGSELPEGAQPLAVGDIECFHRSHVASFDKPKPPTISLADAGKRVPIDLLKSLIATGQLNQSTNGDLWLREVEGIATHYQNIRAEQARMGDEARRLQIARDYVGKVNG